MTRFRRLATAALCCAAVALAPTPVRYPYVEDVRQDRATILWTALEPVEASVDYWSADTASQAPLRRMTLFRAAETALSFDYYQYEAELTGLRPGAEYSYRLRMDGESIPEITPQRFRTAGPGPFTFLVFGDSGLGTREQFQLAAQMETETPSLILHTGDMVYPSGGFNLYQAFYFDPYFRLLARSPVFPTPGNHDYMTRNAAPYLAVHAVPRYYSFDWGNAHFVSLDSNASLTEAAAGRGPMLDWLERDLSATRAFWRIVYMHHAAHTGGGYENDATGALLRTHVTPLLERYRVQLVFNGHEHNYQRTIPVAGTVYVTTGGGGGPLYHVTPGPRFAAVASAHHYVRADVRGREIAIRALGLRGETLDATSLASQPEITAIVNSASYTNEISPGALVTIFGWNLCEEEGQAGSISVTANGRKLPVLFASPRQINVYLPPDAGTGPLTMNVNTSSGAGERKAQVSDVAPGIFNGAIVHADGTPVTSESPAAPGEAVSLYATGIGGASPVVVSVDERPLALSYTGAVSGYPGVYHVDFSLPAALAPGDHMVALSVRNRVSNRVKLATR